MAKVVPSNDELRMKNIETVEMALGCKGIAAKIGNNDLIDRAMEELISSINKDGEVIREEGIYTALRILRVKDCSPEQINALKKVIPNLKEFTKKR